MEQDRMGAGAAEQVEELSASRSLPSGRAAVGIYGTAFFSLSMVPMASLLVPLWMVSLGATPFMIGVAIGARSLLPLVFSIHGGVLMDRLGPRRVTLTVAITAVLLFPAYPLMPWFVAIVILQAIFGLAQGLCWVGSQTFYGRRMRGHAGGAGKLIFFSNGGCFVGPLVLGAIADYFGTRVGFGFLCLWAAAMAGSTLLIPAEEPTGDVQDAEALTGGWRGLLPKLEDYRSAAALCTVPVVMLVMIFTFIRIANASVQTSFYVVYLGQIHMGETLIGVLLGTANFVGTITPVLISRLERYVPVLWVLVGATVMTVVFMAMTPLLVSFWPLLVMAALYGAGVGLGFPNLLIMLSRAIPREEQGKSVGLRTTVNRLASLIIPVVMGAVAQEFGIRSSFFVVGVVLILGTLATTLWVLRRPGLAR